MTADIQDWLPLDYVPQQAALWNSKARFVFQCEHPVGSRRFGGDVP